VVWASGRAPGTDPQGAPPERSNTFGRVSPPAPALAASHPYALLLLLVPALCSLFSRPYALRGDEAPGRSAASSSSGRVDAGFRNLPRVTNPREVGVAGLWAGALSPARRRQDAGHGGPAHSRPRERTRDCWTRERPDHRPHAERRGEHDFRLLLSSLRSAWGRASWPLCGLFVFGKSGCGVQEPPAGYEPAGGWGCRLVGGGSVPREEAAGRGARRPRPQPNPENEPGIVGRGSVRIIAPTRSVGASMISDFFSRPYALRGDGAPGRSAASSFSGRVDAGFRNLPRVTNPREVGVAGLWAGALPPARRRQDAGHGGPAHSRPRERTRDCWTRERPAHRPHAERRGEHDLRLLLSSLRSAWGRGSWPLCGLFVFGEEWTRDSGTSRGLRTRGRLGLQACGRGLCPPRGGDRTREGLCRWAGGRRLPMLYQPCEGESDTAWVDGREWAILAVPAILVHLRDEQACEREWPEGVRRWGIEGYGVALAGAATPVPRSPTAAAAGSPDPGEPGN